MNLGVWLRRIAVGLCLLVFVLALLTARTVFLGERVMAESDRSFDIDRVERSLEQAERAARLYVPGAPHVSAAHARMRAIAVGAERRGDTRLALKAWRAVRASVLGTRHLWTPHEDSLKVANENIARLQAQDAGQSAQEREALQKLLEQSAAPRTLRAVLLSLGFLLSLTGLIGLAWKGLSPDGTVQRRLALASGLTALAGMVCWVWASFGA